MKRREEGHAKLAKKEEEMLTENTEAAVQLNFLALALGSALAAHVEVRPPLRESGTVEQRRMTTATP